jgi:hypothetical protein
MDTHLLDLLRNASTLQLYELAATVQKLLEDSERIHAIRSRLHPGARVRFFNYRDHVLMAEPARRLAT